MYARLFVFLVLVIALVCGKQTSDKAVAKAAKKQLKKAMVRSRSPLTADNFRFRHTVVLTPLHFPFPSPFHFMASPALGGFYYNTWIFISSLISILPSFSLVLRAGRVRPQGGAVRLHVRGRRVWPAELRRQQRQVPVADHDALGEDVRVLLRRVRCRLPRLRLLDVRRVLQDLHHVPQQRPEQELNPFHRRRQQQQ